MSSHYVWDRQLKSWNETKQCIVVGRLVSLKPLDGERYFLIMVLNHVRGPTSFSVLRFVNGVQCLSYSDAALFYGLLDTYDDVEMSLAEIALFEMPCKLCRMFATLIVWSYPKDPKSLWNKFEKAVSEKFSNTVYTVIYIRSKFLQ